ncbi:extracellular solute-binding protein [Chitinimonas sp. BJYL2]|uniref:extracellular solute-binding protein n=1 Tax=Chitinimonas sp. BJYL2 TaxID=2976696 RepID=UPI0022B30009|nr:extracellular solute-binding protein [Chitinimonas sp. BJYL2]
MTHYRMLTLALLGTLSLAASAAGKLHVYNWNDYIADDTVASFEKQFDVKVKYETYDSNEVLQTRLMSGRTDYDIVVPSLEFVPRQIEAGIYQKLDKRKLPNYVHLDKRLLAKMQSIDPGNAYMIPYMWGTTAFAINVNKVRQALGKEAMPADRWELLFNPRYTSKLKRCGIAYMDTGSEVYAMVNLYLGRSASDLSDTALQAANATLAGVRKDIQTFNASPIDLLAKGSVCIAMVHSGDAYMAMDRAAETKSQQVIEYQLPARGAIVWIDSMGIPKDAKNVDNAHRWLNMMLDPKVSASIANAVRYATPNVSARPHLDPDLAKDDKIFLPPELLAKMQTKQPIDAMTQIRVNSYFNMFRSGK